MRLTISRAIVALGASLLLTTGASAQTFKWTYFGELPITHEFPQRIIETTKKIKERTKGRLDITYAFYGETPYKLTDALTVIRDGLGEMSGWLPSYSSGTYPILAAPELPFILPKLPTVAEGQDLVDKAWATPTVAAALGKIVKDSNADIVGSYYFEPMNFWFTTKFETKPVFAGKKVRMFSPEQAALLRALGADPVNIGSPEVYTALQRNVMQGVITGIGSVTGQKFYEVLKSGYLTNIMYTSSMILVNTSKLNELPADLKAVLLEEFSNLAKEIRTVMPSGSDTKRQFLEKGGMSVIDATPSDYGALRDVAAKSVWPGWAERAGADGQKAIQEINAALGGAN